MVLGGFHLSSMSKQDVEEIIKGFKETGVEKVAPCHCSGDLSRELFKKAYGKDYIQAGCGKMIKIKDAY